MKDVQAQFNFEQIVKNNPSGWILRKNLTRETGGLIHSRTEANKDSLGIGIPGRIKIGRKVAYPIESVIKYLQSKIEPMKKKTAESSIISEDREEV